MEKSQPALDAAMRSFYTRVSYQAALDRSKTAHGLARIPWITLLITLGTLLLWSFTAYQTALVSGAHTMQEGIDSIIRDALNNQPQSDEALTQVLLAYGAKENALILQGQYWRFITPIFLHASVLHVSLNMLNFLMLGLFVERLVGPLRFLLIYLLTGIISVVASFAFAPETVSVGASGAIFGLVGAYSIFIFLHRRAFRHGGLPNMLWLLFVIGINLSIGFFIENVDNYAHIGGLVSGFLLGWWFTPLYVVSPTYVLTDIHSLSRRWPLALLTILGTLVLATMCLYLQSGR